MTKAKAKVKRLTEQRTAFEAHGLTRQARLAAKYLLKAQNCLAAAVSNLEKIRQLS